MCKDFLSDLCGREEPTMQCFHIQHFLSDLCGREEATCAVVKTNSANRFSSNIF
ncbi:hypothetical protein E9O_09259 [Moraxella catarrhalis 12P80B1]|nr:hypothetical protein E9O_09259 [Moraxella catarrhalis 12P80B1]EGE21718.1 hypothetical protein E9U_02111 [Moraxella catarrhalis BC8]EGE21849.1 hypothetical protein E9S_01919 [Moraxella catarrhalis BC7]